MSGCGDAPVRSGLIFCQLMPASLVFSTYCEPKYRTCGSCGERATGDVQVKRRSFSYIGVPQTLTARGEMSCAWPVVLSKRSSLPYVSPVYTVFGSRGSGAMYPLSPPPTEYQSRNVMEP